MQSPATQSSASGGTGAVASAPWQCWAAGVVAALLVVLSPMRVAAQDELVSEVVCANLVYANGKTSKCFSRKFLAELESRTHIRTAEEFAPTRLESADLFLFPFAIMSGEGSFQLTEAQRENLRYYLLNGGFLLASAGCSSKSWQKSFDAELKRILPDRELVKLEADHPIFHTVTDVGLSQYKSGGARFPDLYGLIVDGRIAMVYSPDGLNDTAGVDASSCCCCGGNEIKAAAYINMNLLAFALTH